MPDRLSAVSVLVRSSLLATSALLGSFAPPVAAVEPIVGTPLPDEPPVMILPNLIMDALAFDVDGDGVRELLTIGVAADAPGLAAVQVWWVAADGSGEPSNQVHVRRSASVDELTSGQRGLLGIDRDFMIAVKLDEGAKLITVERDGREVALVAAIGSNPDFVNRCCLTIWEIVVEAPGSIQLRLVAATQNSAIELTAADMDADGSDELLVTEGPLDDFAADLDVGLLRWNGDEYMRTKIPIPELSSCCATLLVAGETDGAPGDEVLLSGPRYVAIDDTLISGGLHRVSLRQGSPFVERTADEENAPIDVFGLRAIDLETGPRIVGNREFGALNLWSWPRDGQVAREISRPAGGVPVAAFGAGSDSRIFVASGLPPASVQVLRGDLGMGAGAAQSTTINRDLRAGAFGGVAAEDHTLTPYHGVMPGGMSGAPEGYAFGGQLVRPVASHSEILAEAEPIALLPGLRPIGTVGPAGSWIGLLEGFTGFEPDSVATSMQLIYAPARLRVVARASVMEPEANGGNLEPTFFGVAPDPERPLILLVGNEAADAEIVGPPGTWVGWSTRGGFSEATVGPDGVAPIRLLDEAGPNAPDGSGATVQIWVVTPSGHGYDGTWRIRVYRQPPSLAIADEGAIVNFSPTLSGRTVPGATLTVNGFAVDLAADGTFEAPVMVGLLPTDVRVVATDPVGNRTERIVSVVWPVDYRRLPFVPFAVLLTVAAALVLFLRRPDTGPPTRRTPDDGATFEDIGG